MLLEIMNQILADRKERQYKVSEYSRVESRIWAEQQAMELSSIEYMIRRIQDNDVEGVRCALSLMFYDYRDLCKKYAAKYVRSQMRREARIKAKEATMR